MTTFYGSKKQPKELFGDGTRDHVEFLNALNKLMPGPMALMELMQSCWDPSVDHYHWEYNGKVAHINVLNKFEGHMTVDTSSKKVSVPFRTTVHEAKKDGLSLAANITHFVDQCIKDNVVLAFKKAGKPIATVHDEFVVRPNDTMFLMESYRHALVDVYTDQPIQSILRQITGDDTLVVPQMSDEVYTRTILKSEYALS